MKKILKVIAIICVMSFSLVGCNINGNKNQNEKPNNNNTDVIIENENNENNNDTESNINQNVTGVEVLSNIEKVTGLNNTTKLSQEDINEKFNLAEVEIAEKEIRSIENEEKISEVAVFKVESEEQSLKIIEGIMNRYVELQHKYAENEELTNMLSNSENYIVKQEGGYITYILSEDAKEIEASMK